MSTGSLLSRTGKEAQAALSEPATCSLAQKCCVHACVCMEKCGHEGKIALCVLENVVYFMFKM